MNKMNMHVTVAAVAYRMALKEVEEAKRYWKELLDRDVAGGTDGNFNKAVSDAYKAWKFNEAVAEVQRQTLIITIDEFGLGK